MVQTGSAQGIQVTLLGTGVEVVDTALLQRLGAPMEKADPPRHRQLRLL